MSDPSGVGAQSAEFGAGTNSVGATGDEGRFCGLILTPAAALSTAKVYRGQSATGTPICSLQAAASGNSAVVPIGQLQIPYTNGLTVVVTGVGAVADLFYKPLR